MLDPLRLAGPRNSGWFGRAIESFSQYWLPLNTNQDWLDDYFKIARQPKMALFEVNLAIIAGWRAGSPERS
jgi:hypothetical protein